MEGGGESSDCLRPLRLDWEKSSWSGGKKSPTLQISTFNLPWRFSVCVGGGGLGEHSNTHLDRA